MSIRIRTPEDILASIPYQLGFIPARSLVAIFTRAQVVVLVARQDLPGDLAHLREAGDGFGLCLSRAVKAGADGVVLVAYDDQVPGWLVLDGALADARRSGLRVTFAAVVDGNRWAHVDCRDPACASDWRQLPDATASPSVAEFVGLGRSVLPDRAAKVARLNPDTSFRELLPALSPTQWRTPVRAAAAWREFLDVRASFDGPDTYDPGADAVVALARSLLDRDFRDALIAHLAPGVLPVGQVPFDAARRARALGAAAALQMARGAGSPGHVVERLLARMVLVATRSPDRLAAGPYTVAALLAGWLGDGVTAAAAVEQARAADPAHVLANLLGRLIGLGILPGHRGSLPDVQERGEAGPDAPYGHGVG